MAKFMAMLAAGLLFGCGEGFTDWRTGAAAPDAGSEGLALAITGTVDDLTALEPRLRHASIKDQKIYLTAETPPRLISVASVGTNAGGKSVIMGVKEIGAWWFTDLKDLPGLDQSQRMRQTGDAHLTFIPGTAEAWLSFSGCSPESEAPAEGECIASPLAVRLDATLKSVKSVVLPSSFPNCGHESRVTCSADADCLGVSACDAQSAGVFATGFRRVNAQNSCAPFTSKDLGLSTQLATSIGELVEARGNGVFDVYYASTDLLRLFAVPQSFRRARLRFEGEACRPRLIEDQVATRASSRLAAVLLPPLARPAVIVPFSGGSFGFHGAGARWFVRQDSTMPGTTAVSRLIAQRLSPAGIPDAPEEYLVPPPAVHYLAPQLSPTADGKSTLFYLKYGFRSLTYAACFRHSVRGGPWSGETCPVEATYKDILEASDVNPQNLMTDNIQVGRVAGNTAAMIYLDACEEVAPGEEDVCHLKVWTGPR